ncbi:MAG: DUF1828 domain-containing protein [Deltaproteobacteria bacterium]|nr:DUF1828 domain-containing protein [Deltaproteobacteria bacterium]
MITAEQLRAHLESHKLVREIDQVPRGHFRLETGFLYPDGSFVDVFLVEHSKLLDKLVLSDLGQTTSWLLAISVKPWLSKKRKALLDDAIRLYDVRQEGGALELSLESIDKLGDGVARLGQACVRVADLTYTRRSSIQPFFTEEVEEVIADTDLDYQPNAEIIGKYGNIVRLDFLVQGKRTRSGVLTWGSANASAAHTQANEILRRWFDIEHSEGVEQRLTLFDDRLTSYRDDDTKRLQELSYLYPFSERQAIIEFLVA